MPGRPYLLDNLGPETNHTAALRYLVEDIAAAHQLSIATGYVNIGGLREAAATVTDRAVRLLLGAAPDPGLGAQLPLSRFDMALRGLAGDRDLARFPPSRAAQELAAVESWLKRPDVEVKRFLTQFLHGKAYLFGDLHDGRAAIVSSANLTFAGLNRNLELGLVHYDPPVVKAALMWFNDLWKHADDYKDQLIDLLFPDLGLLDPHTIYLRALLDLYGSEVVGSRPDALPSAVQLAPFQRDGYERARAVLERFHGVVYADGVGTGKTEIGLAFVEEYALRRGLHVLVVCPAQLRENWTARLDRARLPAQVISYQELSTDEQLAPESPYRRRVLHSAKDSYRLVIVDEGHALRTAGTTWYRAMERLLGGERKDLVLLTATPINNGLWDLYNLVMVFARHDRAFAAAGIPSVRALFLRAGANQKDPENLDPDVLFPLADLVSVRRDRRFIEEHYPGAVFPDGTPVRFPTPEPRTERYDLDTDHPGLFHEITDAIGALTMARYRPSAYALGGAEAVEEATLAGLLQSGILKRFESCWWACLKTVQRMIAAHDAFLAAWDQGRVPSRDVLREAAKAEVEEAGAASWVEQQLESDLESVVVEAFRAEYRDHVAADRTLLARMRERLAGLSADGDSKLALLRSLLEASASQKVAVFAGYGETVEYLHEHLPELVGHRSRVTVIGSETDPDARLQALGRFCPETVVREGYQPPEGEVDLLLSTDVLSEGQNLQQAAQVISYDMPWNPQRVVQRYGRVIRLKSPHERVSLVTMLPVPGELEGLLGIEATIRRKILSAGVFGMDAEVVEGAALAELRAYAGRLAGGDPELLEGDDETASGAFTGEQLRAELMRAMSEGELARLEKLPWGVGAGFRQGPGLPSRGAQGIFFACRAQGRRYWRYVEASGEVIEEEVDLLRRINPGTAPPTNLEEIDLESAWDAAASSIVGAHNRLADPRFEAERLGPAQRFALDLLRDPAVSLPTGASRAEEALLVERSSTVRHALAAVRDELGRGSISRNEAARHIVSVVDDFGLQAVSPPPPLEPISQDDIGVVCWMVVLAPGGAERERSAPDDYGMAIKRTLVD
ncbi:MAG TPA: helicase-related protein [Dehalococcoidia bacterium]